MKNNNTKHFFSLVVAAAFLFLAAGSARVNKIHCGAFNKVSSGENRDDQNYVVMNDGSRVGGEKISWKSGLIVKDQIKVGDEKFRIKDTRGYFSNGTYYGRLGNGYAKRIVHGKLNVYYTEEMVTSTSTSHTGQMRTSTRMRCDHYVQVGDNGALTPIANQKDIMAYVKDCPKALEMIDKKDREIRRSIRRNRNYLNEIFITYNNGCR
jgi:hypothetical protein